MSSKSGLPLGILLMKELAGSTEPSIGLHGMAEPAVMYGNIAGSCGDVGTPPNAVL